MPLYSYLHITREGGLTYVLVTQVEDKLSVVNLPLFAFILRLDVELEGGEAGQIG